MASGYHYPGAPATYGYGTLPRPGGGGARYRSTSQPRPSYMDYAEHHQATQPRYPRSQSYDRHNRRSRHNDYQEYMDYNMDRAHYRSTSQPRSSSYGYSSPRRRSHYPEYGDDPRGGYGAEPVAYARYYDAPPVKSYYSPRHAENYLHPQQYNRSGFYTDYPPSMPSKRYGGASYCADQCEYPHPYISPMGYKTVSDRRKYNNGSEGHRYGGEARHAYREPSYAPPPTTDYSYKPRRYSSRYPSDYYNPSYSQPPPQRRVAWEDLSTSALNYRDSSRSVRLSLIISLTLLALINCFG